MNIQELRERHGELLDQMKAISAAAKAAGRGFTAQERSRIEQLKRDDDEVLARIDHEGNDDGNLMSAIDRRIADGNRSAGRRAAGLNTPLNLSVAEYPAHGSTLGFSDFGAFAREVYMSGTSRRTSQSLLDAYGPKFSAVVGMSEGVGSDGGFLVPPGFSSKIFERVYRNSGSLLPMCDTYSITTNQMTWPRNEETSRVNGSRWGGVRAYWVDEGVTVTKSRPKFGKLTLNLHKLMCLAAATDELVSDAPALEQYLFRVFGDEIVFNVNAAILYGTGAGQPLGLLKSPAKVAVAKDSGQPAKTISSTNIVNMWSRLWAGCRQNAVWLINQDVEAQLHLMTVGIGVAGQVVYMPPGGLSSAPYATLMGRPVIATEFAETLGTEGDIILTDLSHYAVATRGGPKTATSMHLYFDTDEMAFRVTYRIDGAPWWVAPLTPYKGTATQSSVVTLATRA